MDQLMVMTKEERREYARRWAMKKRRAAGAKPATRHATEEERTAALRKSRREYQRRNYSAHRNRILIRQFGITLEDYTQMFDAQGGRCAICGKTREEEGRDLAVDHCHATGKVRALLCTRCNTRLAVLEKDAHLLGRMVDYLRENQ